MHVCLCMCLCYTCACIVCACVYACICLCIYVCTMCPYVCVCMARPHSRPAPLNLLFSEPRVPAAVGSAQGLRAPSSPEPPAMRLFLAGRHAAPRMPRPGRLRARRRGTAEFEGSLGERVGPRAVPSLSPPPHATPRSAPPRRPELGRVPHRAALGAPVLAALATAPASVQRSVPEGEAWGYWAAGGGTRNAPGVCGTQLTSASEPSVASSPPA